MNRDLTHSKDKIEELLKDLEMELPQPKFEKIKEELLDILRTGKNCACEIKGETSPMFLQP